MTVVGSSNAVPRPACACSCYLVETSGEAVLFDMGSGALASLQRFRPFDQIDAVVISHMHADHFIDLLPLRYALRYGDRTNDRRVALYLPPDGERILHRMTDVFVGEGGDFLADVFTIATYDPAQPLRIGSSSIRFAPGAHYIPSYAVRLDAEGASVTYSADTGPEERVVALAAETDLFLCEATFPQGVVEDGPRGHCSAGEAGEMAARANVGELVLTHYGAGRDPAAMIAEATRAYGGTIRVAHDGLRIAVRARSLRR